jgi:NADPH-dependent glutamate synthase beta subunit-like oxidoreductase
MEAARVASMLGHKVTLVEASADLGGQLVLAKRGPSLHTIGDIAYWLEQEVYRLGVDVRLGNYFEADDVIAEHPDLVVVATGALPRDDGIQSEHPAHPVAGFDRRHVLSAMDLFADPSRPPVRHALVFDDVGHYEAIAAAEHLLRQGSAVTFVTHFRQMGPNLDPDSRVETAFERFAASGDFTLMTRSHLAEIGEASCTVRTPWRAEPTVVAADLVLFITAKQGLRGLYDELRARGFETGRNLLIIGDALAPRDLQLAITDGHRSMRAWQPGKNLVEANR